MTEPIEFRVSTSDSRASERGAATAEDRPTGDIRSRLFSDPSLSNSVSVNLKEDKSADPSFQRSANQSRSELRMSTPRRALDKLLVIRKRPTVWQVSTAAGDDLVVTECARSAWDTLTSILYDVYLPIISTNTAKVFTESSQARTMIDAYQKFLFQIEVTRGEIDGKVILPIPPASLLHVSLPTTPPPTGIVNAPARQHSGRHQTTKDQIHFLETTIVTWSRIIKAVLRADPDAQSSVSAIQNQNSKETDKKAKAAAKKLQEHNIDANLQPFYPLDEVQIRENRAVNLRIVVDQLKSPTVQSILGQMESIKSSYVSSFRLLEKELLTSLKMAEIVVTYTNLLRPQFDLITDPSVGTDRLITLWPPMMHTVFLIWKRKQYLSSERNLKNILALICNQVIAQARNRISISVLNDFRSNLMFELREALRLCAAFRGSYLDYKQNTDALLKQVSMPLFQKMFLTSLFRFMKKKRRIYTSAWPKRPEALVRCAAGPIVLT